MDAAALWQAIEGTPVASFIKESVWAYPILETIHLIGLGLLFGSIFAYDLRVLGISERISLRALEAHLLPWVWTGFVLNAVSGSLLFSSDAAEFAANPAFQAKLVLIALAGINAAVFHLRAGKRAYGLQEEGAPPRRARISAMVSIVLWTGVIVAGRMIAYVK